MTHPNFSTDGLTTIIASAGGTFVVLIFLVAFQYIFKLEFTCPCEQYENIVFCTLYILLPCFSFILILLVADKLFLELCRSCNTKVCFLRALKSSTVGLLWIVTALMDGDVLVCYKTTLSNITVRKEQPACKKEPNSDDYEIIRHYKYISRVAGLGLLFVVIVLWTVFVCYSKIKGCKCYSKVLYDEYVQEECGRFLEEKIKDLVKNEATAGANEKLEQMKADNSFPQQHAVPPANPEDQRPLLYQQHAK